MLRRGCKASERRRHLSNHLSWQQDLALSGSIYLLREMGPTGFLLREEEPENRDFRVFLGNPHVCNCSTFLKGGELCKHICWVLLKKFKLPRNHECALQLGLVEREISDLLRGIHRVQTPQQGTNDETVHIEEDGYIKQKEIGSDDICSICQEVLLEKKLPVTFCSQVYTPKQVVKSLPLLLITKTSKLLAPGYQCRLCLKAFCLGQHTRLLPCAHKFHRKCIDSWLLYKCNSCPIDGQVIYNPLIWKDTAVNGHTHQSISNTNITHLSKQEEPELFIPGTGLVLKQNRLEILPSIPQHDSEKLNTPESPTDTYQNITIDDLFSIKLDDSNSRRLIYEYKISQHFPKYLQDSLTEHIGKMSSQAFLPSITNKNIICLTAMESPCISEKWHTSQSQKMAKDCKHINHNPKKTLGTRIKDKKRSNTSLQEDLNLIVSWGTSKLSLSKRYSNYMRKVRQKCNLSRRPVSHPLNTKSTELSLILEGVQL
ncbi:E3 ubiquitin-protein ligase ZSWIM2 [Puma concolor]|uniref:RING-type E3 ubiquitin transferase n=1 Tax=Puma concolor TaxID=9696 RepID=A0A6P6IAH6_PUMCO|nr:E3 ubiquitin-protein ligase ZSWIM2 [Puma concolor]